MTGPSRTSRVATPMRRSAAAVASSGTAVSSRASTSPRGAQPMCPTRPRRGWSSSGRSIRTRRRRPTRRRGTWRRDLLDARGSGDRRFRNMLVFLAPDKAGSRSCGTRREHSLAWKSIDEEREQLNLDTWGVEAGRDQAPAVRRGDRRTVRRDVAMVDRSQPTCGRSDWTSGTGRRPGSLVRTRSPFA